MQKLNFSILIKATPAKIWQVLWNDRTYRQWTTVFHPGSYVVSDWQQGSPIQFLGPEGGGMYSEIAECRTNEYMAFRHLAEMKNFEKQPLDEKSQLWSGGMETYRLTKENENILLEVSVEIPEAFASYFDEKFPLAIQLIKEISEKPIGLQIETVVNATPEKVWEYWTMPEHITRWNQASPDWHCPKAENDLKPGGKFSVRMEAKDGSFGFDFGGTYSTVVDRQKIAYTLEDGRNVNIDFIPEDGRVKIVESFEAEDQNSLDLQQTGWQAILDSFKAYTESN